METLNTREIKIKTGVTRAATRAAVFEPFRYGRSSGPNPSYAVFILIKIQPRTRSLGPDLDHGFDHEPVLPSFLCFDLTTLYAFTLFPLQDTGPKISSMKIRKLEQALPKEVDELFQAKGR